MDAQQLRSLLARKPVSVALAVLRVRLDPAKMPNRRHERARVVSAARRSHAGASEPEGDLLVWHDARQCANGFDDVGRGLSAAFAGVSLANAQLAVSSSFPMHDEHDIAVCVIDVGPDLFDDGAHDALLERGVRGVGRRHSLEVAREREVLVKVGRGRGCTSARRPSIDDSLLERGGRLERRVPSPFQFARHRAIVRIDRVVLTFGARGLEARLFRLQFECL